MHDAFNKTISTKVYDLTKQDFSGTYRDGRQFETGLLYPQDGKGKGVKFSDTNKGLNEILIAKTMVVTETSKVHNDYEFTSNKELLPLITHQRQAISNMNLSYLYMVIHC